MQLEYGVWSNPSEFVTEGKVPANGTFVIPVVCPIWLVRCVCACSQWIGKVTGKPSTLNLDKFKILKQRNWLCDTTDAERDFGFKAQYPLKQGVHEAIEWYKQAGWL